MLGPAPVIRTPTNPAFRFATNLLSTALLAALLFQPLLIISEVSADRGRTGICQKGKRYALDRHNQCGSEAVLLIKNIQM